MDEHERSLIANRVQDARRAANLTQDQLAALSGVSRRTIGNIERGQNVPHLDILERLATVIDLTSEAQTRPPWLTSHIETISDLLLALPPRRRDKLMSGYVATLSRALRLHVEGREVTKGLLE